MQYRYKNVNIKVYIMNVYCINQACQFRKRNKKSSKNLELKDPFY